MGVTRIHPKATGGTPPYSGPTSSWNEQYIVDWSEEASHEWRTAPHALVPIEGASWGGTTLTGMGNALLADVVPGSGLEIAPKSTVDCEYYSAITCPRIYSKVTSDASHAGLYPSATPLQAICFQALIQGNVTQDDNGYGMSLTGGGGVNFSVERMHSSSVWPAGSNSGYRISNAYDPGSWNALVISPEDGTTYELFEIVMFPGSLVLGSIRNETEFVEPLGPAVWRRQLSANQYNGNDNALNSWIPSNVYPQFFAYNGSLTTHTATVKAFRVLSLGVL
jgi:hypothetical protein